MATDPNLIDMGLPPEYLAALEQAQRRQAIAQALVQKTQGGVPIQQIGPVAAKISPWAIAANGLAGGLASMNVERAQGEITGVKTRFANDQNQAVQEYLGKPVQERLRMGLASPFPMVQTLAKKDAENQQEQLKSVLTSVGRQNPNAAIDIARTGQLPAGAVSLPGKEVNGQLVDPMALGDYRNQYKDAEFIPGADGKPILVQRGPGNKIDAIDKAPKVSATAHASSAQAKGEDAFLKQIGEDNAKAYGQARTDANMAYSSKSMVQQMQALDKQGVFSGPGAPIVTALAGFGKMLNLPVDGAKLANSEAYQQQFAREIAKVMLTGSVGRSMTDPDRKRFEETLPNLLQSPQGRQQIYNQINAAADAAINRHKVFQQRLGEAYPQEKLAITMNPVDEAPGAPGVIPANPAVSPGTQSQNNGLGSAARPMSPAEYQEYLRKRGK